MALQASFSSSFSSSSSSFSYGWSYDVFLSFRGIDTRHGFTGNLYKALCDRGIRTFIDDKELQRGEEITPALVKAIQESRIAIPVFSKNYASSSFCLDELVMIMEYIKGKGRLVLLVFYDMDPCEVRHQRGSYGEAMVKHEERFKEKVQKWRKALYQAANLSGEDFKLGNEYEYVFIEKIVKGISKKINHVPLHVANYPVGLESRVREVYSLLNDGSNSGVLMVGIYGIGGIGKTTLARAIYNFIADQFEGLCFLENVREDSIKHGLVYLQEKLLCEILGEKDIKLGSVYTGIPSIKHRLCRKKVLLVLDDVDKLEQLQAIVGGPDWFGSGSKVIITTRDNHLLGSHGIERKYEAKGLSENEAFELLSWNAFKYQNVDPSYKDILERVVNYACRLPLALEVIGSNLFGKSIEEWRSALEQYKRIPNNEIQNILKISFDALEEHQQKIFLDIACYFKGYNWAEVKNILYARHDDHLKYGINLLVEKSLIKIYGDSWLTVHDLILDMGKEIARQESLKNPGKRSRLWLPEDIVQILEQNIGTSNIEIIILDAPISEEVAVKWDGKAFKKMTNLETLIIRNACLSEGAKYLPNSLRVLEWWNYPSNSLPSDFHPKKLAILKLQHSSLMLIKFVGKQKLMNLRQLILDNSNIEQISDISGAPNLEELSFEYCVNLIKVHESVGFLNKLRKFSGRRCTNLRSFPPLMLRSLQQFDLSQCVSLESFPEILGEMDRIEMIQWWDTPIKEIPSSITNLTKLKSLQIAVDRPLRLPSSTATVPDLAEVDCRGSGVLQFPKQDEVEKQGSSMVSSIIEDVSFFHCNISDESVPIVLACFRNVVHLELCGNNFTFLPVSIKELCLLETLTLNDCKELTEIRGIPPNIRRLSSANCTSLTSSNRSMLLKKELHKDGDKNFVLPGSNIPKWFNHSSRQNSISFWFRNKFPPISVCVVGGPNEPVEVDCELADFALIVNGFSDYFQFRAYSPFWDSILEANHIITLGERIEPRDRVAEVILENEWNHVVCRVQCEEGQVIKKFGIHVLEHKSNMEDIRFTDPFLQKEEVNMGDFQRNMQPQKNLASLASLETQQGKWLSLRLPPAMNLLNDYVNWDSNSITLMQISSSTGVQALSKDKGKDLLMCNQSREQISIHSCRQELLDMNSESNSIKLASTSDTIKERSFPDNLCTLKLGLDYEAMKLSCHALDSDSDSDSDSNSDSYSIMSSLARLANDNDSEGGCGIISRKRKRDTLTLDLDDEPSETFCCAPSITNLDSDLIMSRLASNTVNEGVTKSTLVNALEKVPQEEEDWSDGEGEEKGKAVEQEEEVPQEEPEDWSDGEGEEKGEVAEQQEEVPQEEPKCQRSKRKAASEGASKPPKSRKASFVTTDPINISCPTGSVHEEKASLKPQKRKYEEVLVDPIPATAKASSRLGIMKSTKFLQPTAFVQEGFSRQSGVQVESHVSDRLPFIQDPSHDPELLSTIDRTKNEENQDKTMAPIDSALFDLSDPFLRDFNDLGKDLVGNNLEQALNDMDGDDLFAELDKMLLGEDPTLAIYSSKAPSVDFSTQAENVPSISLLVECFELLRDKDLESLATDKDLMDSLMAKLTQLGAMISQLPPQFKHPTLKLQRFYKDTFDQFMPAQEAIERHRQLIESKAKLFKDLEGLKKRQVGLAKWSATVKANFDEVTTQEAGLEERNKLAVKKSKLLEYKERSKAALDALKIELSSKLIEVKKLSRELTEAESEAKKAKGIKESLSKQLKGVRQSLKVAKV